MYCLLLKMNDVWGYLLAAVSSHCFHLHLDLRILVELDRQVQSRASTQRTARVWAFQKIHEMANNHLSFGMT
jgi:hypothetical protein